MCQLAANSVNKLDLSKIIAALPVFISHFTCVLPEIRHTPPKVVEVNFSTPAAKINKARLLSSVLPSVNEEAPFELFLKPFSC